MLFCKYKFRGDAKEDELMTEIHRDSVIKVDSPLRCDIQSMKGYFPLFYPLYIGILQVCCPRTQTLTSS